jgi:hypothetical protein
MGRLQRPMIFESKVSADPFERTVQLGNTAERLGAVAGEIEIISTMLKECRLSAQAKTLHSIAGPIQQIIDHLRNGKDLKALLAAQDVFGAICPARDTGAALVHARWRPAQGFTYVRCCSAPPASSPHGLTAPGRIVSRRSHLHAVALRLAVASNLLRRGLALRAPVLRAATALTRRNQAARF